MKTILDWLNELPDGYRERAIKQCGDRSRERNSMAGAILAFVVWGDTEEGHNFWSAVYSFYIKRENTMPPLPKLHIPLTKFKEDFIERLIAALQPFANYACDEPCECNNCVARDLIKEYKESLN